MLESSIIEPIYNSYTIIRRKAKNMLVTADPINVTSEKVKLDEMVNDLKANCILGSKSTTSNRCRTIWIMWIKISIQTSNASEITRTSDQD